jgi:hypothetical protein
MLLVMTLAKDKCFGLVDVDYKKVKGWNRQEASSVQ